ncbi:MAG: hypothetical protein ACYCYK_05040 [Candidatus Dormibacteria bacterium]
MDPAPPSAGFARPASGWFTAARISAFTAAALLFVGALPTLVALLLLGRLFAQADRNAQPPGTLAPAWGLFMVGVAFAVTALVLTGQGRRRVGAGTFAVASVTIGGAVAALGLALHQPPAALLLAAVAFGVMALISALCWSGVTVAQGSNGARLALGVIAVSTLTLVGLYLALAPRRMAQGGLLANLPVIVAAAVMTYGFLADPCVRAAFRHRT